MDRFSILRTDTAEPCHALVAPLNEAALAALSTLPFERPLVDENQLDEAVNNPDHRFSPNENILGDYLSTTAGRARLAAAMMEPMRRRLDSSLARRIFHVDYITETLAPVYDVPSSAYYISELGDRVLSTQSRRLLVPLFDIASNPQIHLSQIRNRRYDLIIRSQDQAFTDLRNMEESHAFSILSEVCRLEEKSLRVNDDTIEGVLRTAFIAFQDNDLGVENIFINTNDHLNIHRLLGTLLVYDNIPGNSGSILGARVHVSNRVPIGEVYLTSDPSYVGVMPFRTQPTILSADDPVAQSLGWSVFENLGMACTNPLGVYRIVLRREGSFR